MIVHLCSHTRTHTRTHTHKPPTAIPDQREPFLGSPYRPPALSSRRRLLRLRQSPVVKRCRAVCWLPRPVQASTMKADEADDGLVLFLGPNAAHRAVSHLLSARVSRRMNGHVLRHVMMVGCSHWERVLADVGCSYWERVLVQLQLLHPVPE